VKVRQKTLHWQQKNANKKGKGSMKLKTWLVLLCVTPSLSAVPKPYSAITCVPVANLAFQPLARLFPKQNIRSLYCEMSLEGTKEAPRLCTRAHQLLLHEQVEILDKKGDEVLVRIHNCYFAVNETKYTEYWSHKSNFISLKKLKNHHIDCSLLPPPLCFEAGTIAPTNNNIATLLFPFYDTTTNRIFSAGTRFVLAQPVNKQDTEIFVWTLNPINITLYQLAIPKNLCIVYYPQDGHRARTAFVQLLRLWARASSDKIIPYVWGGCSFTTLYSPEIITGPDNPSPKSTTPFSLLNKEIMATGFDCAGTILRAAQILNIPYFFKNSLTAHNNLKHISRYEDLACGDILYIKGHVMVVADQENNTLIEARSHFHGFGKLQEIKLSDEFKGIATFRQLVTTCNRGIPLDRLDAQGKIIAQITDAQLLQLPV
jgi:hypothetical protein